MTRPPDTSRRTGRIVLFVATLGLAGAVGFAAWWLGEPAAAPADRRNAAPAPTQPITIAGRTFDLELALDPESRRIGLMHRPYLDPNGGMLFVFPDEQVRRFWMHNCVIDLDVIYLDGAGRIVSYTTMTAPPPDRSTWRLRRYPSGGPARFAIELRAGTTERLGIEPGAVIAGPWDALKRRAE